MFLSQEKLKDLLVGPGYISKKSFQMAVDKAQKSGLDVQDVLIDNNLIKERELGLLLASRFDYPFVELGKEKVDEELLKVIPEKVAKKQKIVVFGKENNHLKVAMLNPDNFLIKEFIKKKYNSNIKVYLAMKNDMKKAFLAYKLGLKDEYEKIVQELNKDNLAKEKRDKLTAKLLDTLIDYAYSAKASDLHIEPFAEEIMVRFRIDGVMHNALRISKRFLDLIVRRLKILAKMKIDEHQSAQDGKVRYKIDDEYIDIRISIIPVSGGENVVMRLLSAKSRQISLDALGLGESDLLKLKKAIKNPHGMILVTGPTGSGKTTTLYEILKILNNESVHIATIEDPVEYDLPGVSQIQVNNQTNLSFAQGLRAIVRQDPDIIMVGEIRDTETADIAVNAAMTGHLLLSTIHANNASTTIPRLLEMGIEPFLLASTIKIVVAQRLVRKLCEKCRYSYEITEEEKKIINSNPKLKQVFKDKKYKSLNKIRLFKADGCKSCANTGYKERLGIFEVLEVDDKIREAIITKKSSAEIEKIAKKNKMTTLLFDGVEKVLAGQTSLAEVLRVAGEK